MSFTCYACVVRRGQAQIARLTESEVVARDAALGDKIDSAVDVLVAAGMTREQAKTRVDELATLPVEIPSYWKIGDHEAWPGEQVWLPDWGVSVGPCEDCRNDRPCRNL